MPEKPNCYDCKYRSDVPGDAHSSCDHPGAMLGSTPLMQAMAIFASVGRIPPVANVHAAKKLNVTGEPHGISHGWFNWPFNFDPIWLLSCDGFEQEEARKQTAEEAGHDHAE